MIRISNVTKTFDGFKALDNLTLTVPKGSIYGLMGLNGAGKSTIINHLADFLRQDEGVITIDGETVNDNESLKQRVQIIQDELYFPRGYKLKNMEEYYRRIYQKWNQARYREIISDFGLPENKSIRAFSKGMKKQAAFALALAATPDVLILDEPIDGLDPIIKRKLWKFVMDDVADREMTVLVSSHNAKEMENVCDHIGIMSNGKIVFEGNLLELMPVSIEEIFIEKLGGNIEYHNPNFEQGSKAVGGHAVTGGEYDEK